MNKYTLILERFCSTNDLRPWMLTPFAIGENVYATDGHSMIIMPKWFSPDTPELTMLAPEKILSVIASDNMNVPITLTQLSEAIAKVPFEMVHKKDECDACNGDGKVWFSFEHKGKEYDRDGSCPVCDGEGEITDLTSENVKEYSEDYRIKILDQVFDPNILELLEFTVKQLGAEDFQIVSQAEVKRGTTFQIGYVRVMQMPIVDDDRETIVLL